MRGIGLALLLGVPGVGPTAAAACINMFGDLAGVLKATQNPEKFAAAFKEVLAAQGLKMPQLAVPVRVLVCGRAQTPSLDAVLEHFDQKKVLERLQAV